jgi:hypothetical protein
MNSGEKAKPPATFEERNPFDISRRSGPEVAAEIAKRMAAWKQARARTTRPSTAPVVSSSGETKLPPIAVPVQPARMPKSTTPAPQQAAAARDGKRPAASVPYFASSAARRAMPPAPSLKQSATEPPLPPKIAEHAEEPVVAAAAPQQDSPRLDLTDTGVAAQSETPTAAASIEAAPAKMDATPADVQPDLVEPAPVETPEPVAGEPDDAERRRAEARAIKARWIAARDLDALIEAPAAGASATEARNAGEADDRSALPPAPAPDRDVAPPVEETEEVPGNSSQDEAPAPAAMSGPAATVEEDAPKVAAATPAPVEAPQEVEPVIDLPMADVSAAGRDDAPDPLPLDLAALDEMAGRKEPTFDVPLARAMPDDTSRPLESAAAREDLADQSQAPSTFEAGAAPQRDTSGDDPSIAALDDVAGRREPTFDTPVQRAQTTAPTQAPAAGEPKRAPAVASEAPRIEIAALDEAAGRKEPTLDEPARPAKPAAAQAAAPRITLRPIETRIEARRVETLRADPQLAARRPIFPRIEPEDWPVPPAVAAQNGRARRGAGWAIGLGSVLLIAGITAPAAIWQQGRQAQDEAALVTPLPQQQQAAAPAVVAPAPTTLPPATLPEAPEPAAGPTVAAQEPATPAPASQAPASQAPAEPKAESPQASKPAAEQSVAEQILAKPKPATTLSAIGDGEAVNDAPVVAPPSPTVSLASKPVSTGTTSPMVARPFIPEKGNGHFLRAPTTGATSVPVAGAPVQAAGVGVKPSLMVKLKPKAAATASSSRVISKPKPVARKPKPFFQQSPDQMFETLVKTLSQGKPVNPNTKPEPPTTRR